jgi:hypothetical protein
MRPILYCLPSRAGRRTAPPRRACCASPTSTGTASPSSTAATSTPPRSTAARRSGSPRTRAGALSQVLARRPVDRVLGRVLRHAPGLGDARLSAATPRQLTFYTTSARCRRAAARTTACSTGRRTASTCWCAPIARPTASATACRCWCPSRAAWKSRSARRRPAAACCPRRQHLRLHADRPRVPHLEAPPRRARAERLDL